MKYLYIVGLCFLFPITVLSQTNNDVIQKLTSHFWKVDQFYIDSVRVYDKQLDSMIYQFYVNGDFVCNKKILSESNVKWSYDFETKVLLISFSQGTVYKFYVKVLLDSIFVYTQDVYDKQGNLYKAEYRLTSY